jgi:hypothetical protein
VEVEVQRPSGTFYTSFLGGFTSVYGDVTNVVARLSWPDVGAGAPGDGTATGGAAFATAARAVPPVGVGAGQPAMLVNAHFDSAPNADGASDDLVGCVRVARRCDCSCAKERERERARAQEKNNSTLIMDTRTT